MTTYTAVVEQRADGGRGAVDRHYFELESATESEARQATLKIAAEYPDDLVFCEFSRASDRQHGLVDLN